MTSNKLTESWSSNFPNFSPIAHELKDEFNERWFRIHTLPESKRYPENEQEFSEILSRHNSILTDLFGANHKYYLLTNSYGLSLEKIKKEAKLVKLNLQKNYWQSVNIAEKDFEPYYWHIHFDEKDWAEGSVDDLFRLVANDAIGNVILFSADKKIVYHPYDGGADIIFENCDLRDFYKEKYKDWLSIHPSGF